MRHLAPILLALLLTACQAPAPKPSATAPATFSSEVRAILPELAKAHNDKIQLAWYATSLLRKLDPEPKAFVQQMGAQHKRLLEQLKTYAAANRIDLTFRYPPDLLGKARKISEDATGKILQNDSQPDFQRDLLLLMFQDYQSQRYLLTTLLPEARDPSLRDYLEDSLRLHNAHFQEIRTLLARYHYR